MAKEKPLILETDENGCITPKSHALNQDGYFRKWIPERKKMVMYHIYSWEVINGPIPEGFEINHLCKNRACCNVEHLECIDGKAHTIKTNEERYSERKQKAFEYWSRVGCKGVVLAGIFDVTPSAACRWIRGWKV